MKLVKAVTLALLLLLGLAARASAQTNVLSWIAPSNTIAGADAQALTYTLYVNNGAGAVVAGVTCTGAVSPAPCSAPLPAGLPTAIGTKLELTALSAAGGGESPRSLPFIQAPTAPTVFRKQ